MKKRNATKILMWVFALAPLAATAVLYGRLPSDIPTHWGFDGAVTYGPKGMIWPVACLGIFFAALFTLLPSIDPRKKNYGKFRNSYDFFCLVMTAFCMGVTLVILSESFNPGQISVDSVVTGGVGLLFVIIGNMMPKIKSNFFMGIRTPWTLSSPEVWSRTHRLGGALMFIAGILILLSPLALGERAMFAVLMACVLVSSLVPVVMSYIWYKRLEKPAEPDRPDGE